MPSYIKCLIGVLLLGIVVAFVQPIPAQAADARCLRISIIVDDTNQTTMSYDYNPSTNAFTIFMQYNPIIWYDESPNGRWVATKVSGEEKGVELISFVDRITQRSVDYDMADAFNSSGTQGGRLMPSGWSPDGTYFAMPVINYVNEVEESWLLIFGRDHSLMTQVPYNDQGGRSVWSWLPDSKRIVIAQALPSETSSDKIDYTVGVASLSGAVVETKLAEPLSGGPFVISSPNGNFAAVLDLVGLFVMDTRTGEIVTVSQNVPPYQTVLDVSWSPNSQYLLYKTPAETDASHVNVMRYSTATQESAVVVENVSIPYMAGSYTALSVPVPRDGAMFVRQQNEEEILFQLIDGQSGTIQEVAEEPVNDMGLSAMSEWSPLGDVVWVSEATTTFFRPETRTQVTLPEGSALVPMYNALMGRWSENGEWISVLVQNSDSTVALMVINTRTGKVRTIPTETIPDYEMYSFYAITSNTGAVMIVQSGSLSLVLQDGSLTRLTESLHWSGIEYGNNGAVWSPDGTKLALIEPSLEDSSLSTVKIFQSSGTLIDSIDNIAAAASSIESLNWGPCL